MLWKSLHALRGKISASGREAAGAGRESGAPGYLREAKALCASATSGRGAGFFGFGEKWPERTSGPLVPTHRGESAPCFRYGRGKHSRSGAEFRPYRGETTLSFCCVGGGRKRAKPVKAWLGWMGFRDYISPVPSDFPWCASLGYWQHSS